ncbi:MAG: sortase [Actinomycetota bacterium]|jgi:sortase A|nr:sortase [Actinomycetota bacterium]
MSWVRRAVSALGEVLITAGLFLLLFVVWQLWWTDVTADRTQAAAIQSIEKGFGPAGLAERGNEVTPAPPVLKATLTKVPFGQAFGIMRVPRFGSSYARPVLQGTDHDTLTNGIGHYSGTAFPGQVGNFAVAGHRTTYGKPFANVELLRKGDVIVIETKASYIVYAVDRHVIVTPDHVEVIAPVPQHKGFQPKQAWMTMTACHPRFSASHRYVVFSRFVKTIPRASGLPASYMKIPAGS